MLVGQDCCANSCRELNEQINIGFNHSIMATQWLHTNRNDAVQLDMMFGMRRKYPTMR